MHTKRLLTLATALTIAASSLLAIDPPAAPVAGAQKAIEFPHLTIDREKRELRIAAESVAVEGPLEFFCVVRNGPEHETVLRTDAKPSHIHAGLLMLGLQPGSPVRYVQSSNSWVAPFGPPLRVSVEFKNKAGDIVRLGAEQLMRNIRTKAAMPASQFIFAGSQQRDDGTYLADLTGYVVSIVNFEMSLIDVPEIVSSDNAKLEWEYNADVGPARGEKVTLILTPIGDAQPATTQPAVKSAGDDDITALRARWLASVRPHAGAMREAAQTHYDVLMDLRRRQQSLLDEADKLQRLIDELEAQYAEMTTPQPGDATTQPAK
jgi:hypothetical protein